MKAAGENYRNGWPAAESVTMTENSALAAGNGAETSGAQLMALWRNGAGVCQLQPILAISAAASSFSWLWLAGQRKHRMKEMQS